MRRFEQELLRKKQSADAYAIRSVRSHGDARDLCAGESEHMVHPGIRCGLHSRFRIWLSTRRVALRSGRDHLVDSRSQTLVEGAVSSECLNEMKAIEIRAMK